MTQFVKCHWRQRDHIHRAARQGGKDGQVTNQRPGTHQGDHRFLTLMVKIACFSNTCTNQIDIIPPIGRIHQLVISRYGKNAMVLQ